MNLSALTIHEADRLLRQGQTTSVELTRAVLDRIAAVEPKVKAYITVTAESALEEAKAADARRQRGESRGPLDGIPLAIKDVLCTQGVKTTCGSQILNNFVPPYDATAIRRLREAGFVLVGKANMDEFAMGSSCENSAFYPTHNPWDLSRVPGGSSGGSGAAVAADEALGALGTDTGGSIRLPASFCGVVGLKPTYGRVSRYGLVAFASSLDVVGPVAKDVTDAAILLQAIAGPDERDATTPRVPVPNYLASLRGGLQGLRIGIPSEYFAEGIQPGVEAAVRAAIDRLQEMGAVVDEVSLPHTHYAVAAYYIIAPAEASANLARYDGVKYGFLAPAEDMWSTMERTRGEGFGPEVKRRIMLGTYTLSAGYYEAYYLKAQKVRTLIKRDFDAAFSRFDVLAAPTAPSTAFKLGEKVDDPVAMYLSDVFTVTANAAGIPGIVVPCGFDQGLPVGLQFLGKPFDEATLFRAAYAYEQATEWHKQKPPLK
ncbi:MAG: Asp-tRNA(Asn)/Glu-tRNA(Gln) amidotransferase subunit GatA [Dehalococcoidales bacterium]|nr:Asp-tRNA(Asn)/Glu-tRNA(Gln) amidotransferase subunit GatA [Dehalococcoidales bacterium]